MNLPYDPELADRMVEMDPALLHLLRYEVNSFARWDALRALLESEREEATMDEMAFQVGREGASLLGVVGELTARGWLARRVNEAGETSYLLTQEEDRRRLLDQLRDAMQEQGFRLQAFYHWTQGVGGEG